MLLGLWPVCRAAYHMLVLKSPPQLPSLPFRLLVPQQGGTQLFGLFLADVLGVVGDAGLTQIVGDGRERALGDRRAAV
jgi:hypothetical protein